MYYSKNICSHCGETYALYCKVKPSKNEDYGFACQVSNNFPKDRTPIKGKDLIWSERIDTKDYVEVTKS